SPPGLLYAQGLSDWPLPSSLRPTRSGSALCRAEAASKVRRWITEGVRGVHALASISDRVHGNFGQTFSSDNKLLLISKITLLVIPIANSSFSSTIEISCSPSNL